MTFTLRFDKDSIQQWADQFDLTEDTLVEKEIVPQVQAQGHLTREALVALCNWKSPRTRKYVADNDESFIKVVTQTAFSTPDEQLRISVLTLLRGVNWPTASVILHFCHPDPYPILDFRALWSLGVQIPEQIDFDFWWPYTQYCRDLAAQAGVSMRTLDRALWQYAKQHQAGMKAVGEKD